MKNEEVSIYLQCQEGTSDKVYNVHLKNQYPGSIRWNVTAEWGRRGGSLKSQVKCSDASYSFAISVFNDLVREKRNKGYLEVINASINMFCPNCLTYDLSPTKHIADSRKEFGDYMCKKCVATFDKLSKKVGE